MRIYSDGMMFKAVHISGPTHNYLGISFNDGDGGNVEVDAVAPEAGELARLNASDVYDSVMHGVDLANEHFGTTYKVKVIQFVLSDSPVTGIYADMARAIVEKMHVERRE